MLTAAQSQQAIPRDWRVLNGGASAWFVTPDHTTGAGLADRILAVAGGSVDIDVRRRGVLLRAPRPRAGFDDDAVETLRAVSQHAQDLGLRAAPDTLRSLQLALDVADVQTAATFWAAALGHEQVTHDLLADPARRLPRLWLQEIGEPRPHRQRLHLDVARSGGLDADRAADAGGQHLGGPYGVRFADSEGNEADLLPADPLDGGEDWVAGFAAVTSYRVSDPATASTLVTTVARLADAADLPLKIDVRPGVVVIDSDKDLWESEPGFGALAAQVQSAARGLGLTAEHRRLGFVQLVFDVVDLEACRQFWRATLDLVDDHRDGVTDLIDPLGLMPVLVFQELDATDAERRQQRNRFHLDLFVPDDQADAVVERAVAAGGRIVRDEDAPDFWTIADPEGNEVCIAVAVGREERAEQRGGQK